MFRGLLPWAGFLAVVWWVLEPDPGSWAAGVVAIAAGLFLRLYAGRLQQVGVRPLRLAGFVPYFFGQSVLGGWDVSRRALARAMPLSPSVMIHRLTLPSEPARVFLSNTLSLLPGTVAADLRDEVLVVHLLAGGPDTELRVRDLEKRVARLFEARDA